MNVARRLDPAIATRLMLDAGISPLVPYINSKTNWNSRCLKCKKMISPRLNDVVQGKRCGHCAGVVPDMKKTQGHTETVGADSVTLLQLEKIINKVIRGMKNG